MAKNKQTKAELQAAADELVQASAEAVELLALLLEGNTVIPASRASAVIGRIEAAAQEV
jgi:hypothetical protein